MKLTDEVLECAGKAMHRASSQHKDTDAFIAAIRALRDTAADAVLFHEQDYGFCLDPKCRCCAVLKKLKALLPKVNR